MPSSYKTPFLGLNRFTGADKPKMEDVNFDNQTLDQRLKEHFEDREGHITGEERQRWNQPAFQVGSYVGDGSNGRIIQLGYDPALLLLFCSGEMTSEYNGGADQNSQQWGILTGNGGTFGLTRVSQGFQVANVTTNTANGRRGRLNLEGKTYIYIAFR